MERICGINDSCLNEEQQRYYKEIYSYVGGKRGSLLIEDRYNNRDFSSSSKRYFFVIKCGAAHWFNPELDFTKTGSWCPKCLYDKDHPPQSIIDAKGGKILSMWLDDDHHLYRYFLECREGHQWFSSKGNITRKDNWCPECKDKDEKEQREKRRREKEKNFLCSELLKGVILVLIFLVLIR